MVVVLALFIVMLPVRGRIEQIRQDPKHRLAPEVLSAGDVDPTSTLAILVLGGMRGVACNILWSEALDFYKKKKWNELEAVVHSIVKLQPHFISIWTFQSWNLAYNVSVEWDQVEDKYRWIKRGIKFVSEGIRKNQHSPELRWDRGWYFFHKIGKSDEHVLLRKLYREDTLPEIDAFGREQPPFNPYGKDNYETAKESFVDAVQTLDRLHVKPKRMSEVPFRSYPAHSQTDYAAAREEEGVFGEIMQRDWLDAYEDWVRFGDHEYEYFNGKKVKLDYPPEIYSALFGVKELLEETDRLRAKLAVEPEKGQGAGSISERDLLRLMDHAHSVLNLFGQPVLDILPEGAAPVRDRTRAAFNELRGMSASQLNDSGEVGRQARAKLEAFRDALYKLERLADEELYWNNRYANMVNYRYWKERARAEATWDMIHARENFYIGNKAYEEGDPETARTRYEAGLALLKKVLDKYPRVRNDDLTIEETAKIVKKYLKVRAQLDLPPPKPIPFESFLKKVEAPPPTAEELLKYELYYRAMRKAEEASQGLPAEAPGEKKRAGSEQQKK